MFVFQWLSASVVRVSYFIEIENNGPYRKSKLEKFVKKRVKTSRAEFLRPLKLRLGVCQWTSICPHLILIQWFGIWFIIT